VLSFITLNTLNLLIDIEDPL